MNFILGISLILLFGVLSGKIAEKIKTPAITAYLVLGIFIGPYAARFVPMSVLNASGIISNFALSIIAFSIGQNFSFSIFKQIGKQVIWISVLAAFGAWVFVVVGMRMIGLPLYVALIFGAISTATAPAALIMVIRQYKAKGKFTDILMGVVAIDDAWGLIVFSVCLAFARKIHFNQAASMAQVIIGSLLQIGLSLVMGGIIGWMFCTFAYHIRNKRDLLIYTIGTIFLTAGLALHFHLSVLLSCMILSAVIVNIHKESFRFFDVLQTIDWPIYLIFFVLAGANLEIEMLKHIGLIGVVYLIARVVGKCIGTYFGAVFSHAGHEVKTYMGIAQMPQAGVALGMALISKSVFPELGSMIFTAVAATTIIYEIIGPFFVKLSLYKTGQIQNQ
ncbi:MAG: cation:proton antiporter [Candidatus Omnitrophica bacterium]|nr:cation:proton antiporter [Candidatus Omnitrophota bacterium]